ncbi:MAG: hypothetical protein AAFV90_09325 [Cyanobacteria bacterium J06634_5]
MKTDSSCFCALYGRYLSLKKLRKDLLFFNKDEKQTISNRLAYDSSELTVFELTVFELAVFELAAPVLTLTTLVSREFFQQLANRARALLLW